MAYTVGSASVDIVPDFKNAQLAITKFFNQQQDQIRIPVKLDVSQTGTTDVERQAAQVGTRVSKAMNAAMTRNQRDADRLAVQMAEGREKAITRAHAEALRMQAQMDKERREQERLADQIVEGRIRSRQQAHVEALRINAQMDREAARQRAETIRSIDRAHAEALKIQTERERDQNRLVEQMYEGRMRILREHHTEALRMNEQFDRERARQARQREQDEINELKRILKEVEGEEKIRLKIEIDRRQAILDGRQVGGLITRSIHHEIRQNAGLIAAVIGGILIAGAPAAIGGAVALFGGIGAVAAAQSQRVQQAWVGTWDEIKQGAIDDAAVLVPVLTRAAAQIGEGFQRMRPQIEEAFVATGPHIDSFTGAIVRAAETALPGLVNSVQEAGPVVQGLGNLLESIGTGIGDFFDILSTHAPAAGEAATELGRTMEALLPIFAELLGQGAETATVVLPAVTAAFQGVHAVLGALGGSLPAVLTAFLAFRALQGTGKLIGNFGASMALAAEKGGMLAGAQTRVSNVASRVSGAMPGVAAAVGVVAAIMARGEQQSTDWAQAILRGGKAADTARSQMSSFGEALRTTNTGFGGILAGLVGITATFGITAKAVDDTQQEIDEYKESLSPVERAQHDLDVATRELGEALDEEGVSANKLGRLKGEVAKAADRLADAQAAVEKATRGVTEAMNDQADAARARVDSEFAYEKALIDVEKSLVDLADAQNGLNEARKTGDPEQIAAAELELREAILGVNDAYGEQIDVARERAISKLPAALDDEQKKLVGNKAALEELNRLIAAGVELPQSLLDYRDYLKSVTEGANSAQVEQAQLVESLKEVGAAVTTIPDTASVRIEAPTEEVKQRLIDLGFAVVDIEDSKDILVTAVTEEAKANLGDLSNQMSDLHESVTAPTVDVRDEPFRDGMQESRNSLYDLDAEIAVPDADLDVKKFDGKYTGAMGNISNLDRQRPTPAGDLRLDMFNRNYQGALGAVGNLDRQRAEPDAFLNDLVSGAARAAQAVLDGMRDKTVTLTLQERRVITTMTNNQVMFRQLGGATGGAVEDLGPRTKYADGGAVFGRGGPIDDLIPAVGPWGTPDHWLSNGEHILDARDVALLGGQAGVYAFREALNSGGRISGPGRDDGIAQMVAAGGSPAAVAPQPTAVREINLYTPDVAEAVRQLKALEHQEAVMASPWRGR